MGKRFHFFTSHLSFHSMSRSIEEIRTKKRDGSILYKTIENHSVSQLHTKQWSVGKHRRGNLTTPRLKSLSAQVKIWKFTKEKQLQADTNLAFQHWSTSTCRLLLLERRKTFRMQLRNGLKICTRNRIQMYKLQRSKKPAQSTSTKWEARQRPVLSCMFESHPVCLYSRDRDNKNNNKR